MIIEAQQMVFRLIKAYLYLQGRVQKSDGLGFVNKIAFTLMLNTWFCVIGPYGFPGTREIIYTFTIFTMFKN